jgi:hypothetical protein
VCLFKEVNHDYHVRKSPGAQCRVYLSVPPWTGSLPLPLRRAAGGVSQAGTSGTQGRWPSTPPRYFTQRQVLSPAVDEISVVVAAVYDPNSDVLLCSDRVWDEIANPLIATYRLSERCGSPVPAVCARPEVRCIHFGGRKMAGERGFEPRIWA